MPENILAVLTHSIERCVPLLVELAVTVEGLEFPLSSGDQDKVIGDLVSSTGPELVVRPC